jgi:hypothetical protein
LKLSSSESPGLAFAIKTGSDEQPASLAGFVREALEFGPVTFGARVGVSVLNLTLRLLSFVWPAELR